MCPSHAWLALASTCLHSETGKQVDLDCPCVDAASAWLVHHLMHHDLFTSKLGLTPSASQIDDGFCDYHSLMRDASPA